MFPFNPSRIPSGNGNQRGAVIRDQCGERVMVVHKDAFPRFLSRSLPTHITRSYPTILSQLFVLCKA